MVPIDERQFRSTLTPPWGWRGTFAEFTSTSLQKFLSSIFRHAQCRWGDEPISMDQVDSWIREFDLLQPLLKVFLIEYPVASTAVLTFEYELILERGDRPDIVLSLPHSRAIVIECKNRGKTRPADISQVCGYSRKLELFQSVRQARPVILLLQEMQIGEESAKSTHQRKKGTVDTEQPAFAFDAEVQPVSICDATPAGLALLLSILRTEFTQCHSASETLGLPDECYSPLPQVVTSVCEAIHRIARQRRTLDLPIQQIVTRVLDAQASGEHVLVVVSGEAMSGKTLLGMLTAAELWERGVPSLYLTGDWPIPKDVESYCQQISKLTGDFESAAFIRKLSSFPRVLTRHESELNISALVLDNTGENALAPENLQYPRWESGLLSFAETRPWTAIIIVLDFEGEFWNGGLNEAMMHWFRRLLFHQRSRPWKFLCPQLFGIGSTQAERYGIHLVCDKNLYIGTKPLPEPPPCGGDDLLAGVQGYSKLDPHTRAMHWEKFKTYIWSAFCVNSQIAPESSEFKWSMEMLTFRMLRGRETVMHELAARGYLQEVPTVLLTWDSLTLGQSDLHGTPLQCAAEHGHLNQIPLQVVSNHLREVTRVVMTAVDNSRKAGRTDRRVNSWRWLLRAAIAEKGAEAAACPEVINFVKDVACEAARNGTPVPVPDAAVIMNEASDDFIEAAIKAYQLTGDEAQLDAAIFSEYLTNLEKRR